jgi:hypothetical protein
MLSARVLAIDRRASGARARVRRRASARASATRASTSPRRRTPRARVLAPRVDVRGAPYRDATTNRRSIGSRDLWMYYGFTVRARAHLTRFER